MEGKNITQSQNDMFVGTASCKDALCRDAINCVFTTTSQNDMSVDTSCRDGAHPVFTTTSAKNNVTMILRIKKISILYKSYLCIFYSYLSIQNPLVSLFVVGITSLRLRTGCVDVGLGAGLGFGGAVVVAGLVLEDGEEGVEAAGELEVLG